MLVLIYLIAIVTANLLASWLGPSITIFSAFVFIGLDLSLRDRLHDEWKDHLVLKMSALIAAGGLLSYFANPAAGRIAIASTVAFTVAATADGVVYHLAQRYEKFHQMNLSNVAGAAFDSVLFPLIAFGGFLPFITAGQFAAKVGGGAVWAAVILLVRRQRVLAGNEG